MSTIWDHPFGVTWRKALVSLPRLVPSAFLRYTSGEGPQPIIIYLESRGSHQIPVYAFVPESIVGQTHVKLPVLIDFHGGGFVIGSCLEQAPFCSKFARELGCLALSVDYRLGPYAQFPAANEDAEDVVKAVVDSASPGYQSLRDAIRNHAKSLSKAAGKDVPDPIEIDDTRLAFSGFSSGGNLALNLAISLAPSAEMSKPWPSAIPPNFPREVPLLLFYPSLDCRLLPSQRPRPPGQESKPSFLASLKIEDSLMPTYLPRDEAEYPRASPGLAQISDGGLHEQARIMLVLPELDSLAEQSEAWIEKVEIEGRSRHLTVKRYRGMMHGWTQFPDIFLDAIAKERKYEVFDAAVDFVRNRWELES